MKRAAFHGLVAFAALLCATTAGAANDARGGDDRSMRIPVEGKTRLEVDVINGSIELRGWDEAHIQVRTRSGELDKVDIKASGEVVNVRGSQVGIGFIRIPLSGANVDLEIDLPRALEVEARTVNGKIEVEGLSGRLTLHAAHGGLRVEGPVAEAVLETVNANIEFEGENSRVEARAVNGRIELKGVAGEVSANTMAGSIEVEAGAVSRVDLRTLSGSIELSAVLEPDARVHLKTYSGNVKLELPEDTNAEFDVQSFSGRIENDLPTTSVSSWRGGPGQRMDFVAGDGSARVTVQSFSGNVEIDER